MILYYTASQKTKIFAEALAKATGLPLWQLNSQLEKKSKFVFRIRALLLAVSGKAYPVDNMPAGIDGDEIYLCAPIWGGQVTGPPWYFLNHADLKGKKVNLLITSSSDNFKYKKKAQETLGLIDCVPGEVYCFAATPNPEPDLILEQLREMLPERPCAQGKPLDA